MCLSVAGSDPLVCRPQGSSVASLVSELPFKGCIVLPLTYVPHLVHSLIWWSPLPATGNNAEMDVTVQISLLDPACNRPGFIPSKLSSVMILFLIFEKPPRCFP